MKRRSVLCVVAMAVLALGVGHDVSVTAAPSPRPASPAAVAQRILDGPAAAYLTAPLRLALLSRGGSVPSVTPPLAPAVPQFRGTRPVPGPGRLRNVRVNDPGRDTHQPDQTTQSEPSAAVRGRRVVVGYSDSQQSLLSITAATDLNGVAYSTDGGATYTDAGTVANAPGEQNIGSPWLAVDRRGTFYYSSLVNSGADVVVGVARSTDGRHWSTPTHAAPADPAAAAYLADKNSLTVGPAPGAPTSDVLYATWDDQVQTADGTLLNGLPVSHSVDGGRSWQVSYADRYTVGSDCSFQRYSGAQTSVAADGSVRLFAQRMFRDDPECTSNQAFSFEQDMFLSTDGGRHWGPRIAVAPVVPVAAAGLLSLGPGSGIRTAQYPSVAAVGGTLYVAWNDGAGGTAHIRLARSGDGGHTWTTSWASSGPGADLQPALAADRTGLHLLYYRVNQSDQIDVVLADAAGAGRFTGRRVNTRSFGGVPNLPQFDPVNPPGYLGDYLSLTAADGRLYMAWGDNRDVVRSFLWPDGRPDPDVFAAVR